MIDLKKINIFKLTSGIKNAAIRNTVIGKTLTYAIPFNMGFGLKIKELTPDIAVIDMPPKFRRRNHLGTAHAIAQCLQSYSHTMFVSMVCYLYKEYQLTL